MGFLSSLGGIVGSVFGGPVGGLIGGALGGAGDSLISGNAASDASKTQAAGFDAATKLQADIYNQNRTDRLPYLGAGTAANNTLAYLMGVTPNDPNAGAKNADGTPKESTFNPMAGVNTSLYSSGQLAKPFTPSDLTLDPSYQFRLQQGQKALERSSAARGNLFSGATGKALMDYGQGAASQEYQAAFERYNTNQNNLYNRLAGLSGSGLSAANTGAQSGQNYANATSPLITNAAQQRADANASTANAWQSGLGNAAGQIFSAGTQAGWW